METPPRLPIEPIPAQEAGPYFTLSDDNKVCLVPTSEIDNAGNNIGRIRQLLPEVRRIADRLGQLLNSSNTHPELADALAEYSGAIGREGETQAWGVVFLRGLSLENAAAASRRQIDRMQPSLEDRAQADLYTLVDYHGLLMLSTADGSKLMEEVARIRLTRDEQAEVREAATIIAEQLLKVPELVDPPAGKVIERAAGAIGEGHHPERGTAVGIATIRNVATIVIPAAVLVGAAHVAGGVAAGLGEIALAAGTLAYWQNERVQEAARALGAKFDWAFRYDREKFLQKLSRLPYLELSRNIAKPLREIAKYSQHFSWAPSWLDFLGAPRQPIGRDLIIPEMVVIPAGTFTMGSTEPGYLDEAPLHSVTMSRNFAIGRYPVTNNEYACFRKIKTPTQADDEKWGRLPAVNVSWDDAQAYVAWLSEKTGLTFRLPSEAEWEYACRGGTNTRYSFGDVVDPEAAALPLNCAGCKGSPKRTTEVGAYGENPWGVGDMHGNVLEWVEDGYAKYEDVPTDGSAWKAPPTAESSRNRAIRGGSWKKPPMECRSSRRDRIDRATVNDDTGFRVARTLES